MYQSEWRFSKSTDYLRRYFNRKVKKNKELLLSVSFSWKLGKRFEGRWTTANGPAEAPRSWLHQQCPSKRVHREHKYRRRYVLRMSAAPSMMEWVRLGSISLYFSLSVPMQRRRTFLLRIDSSPRSSFLFFHTHNAPVIFFWYSKIFIYSTRLGIGK